MKKIAVIGGGWYGCHIARVLKLEGHDVTIFEINDKIFKGVSGNLGIRLHAGPHYPRSEKTRKTCREGFLEFSKTYPDLIVEHAYSIYGLGILDANNEPPKIDLDTFRKVGMEVKNSREIDPEKWGYKNLQSAFDNKEPSILLGAPLREKFEKILKEIGVKIVYNVKVNKLTRTKTNETHVIGEKNFCLGIFDYAVNTTSYQALLPSPESALPFKLDIFYQPCLALVYEDRLSKVLSLPPFSFIVMDGWFPCIMPYITNKEEAGRKYIVTHGKYTIMGSFKTIEEANACLAKIDDNFITAHVQPKCEAEMERFWPMFGALIPDSKERRFQYVGYKAAIFAKVKTNREFRSAITFARDGVVYVIPGKVSNIFDAGRETMALINNQNVLHQGSYQYVKNGVLDEAVSGITEAVNPEIRNTFSLQTFAETTGSPNKKEKSIPPESIQGSSSKSGFSARRLLLKDSTLFFQPQPKNPKINSMADSNDCEIKIKSSL